MDYRVPYDELHDKLSELDGTNPGPDGRWTLRPVRRILTLTSSKHVDGNQHVVAQAEDWDDFEMSWPSQDLFRLRVGDTTFYLPRDQVGEVLDVNLPEQPYVRRRCAAR
jgi:hypothetical protein